MEAIRASGHKKSLAGGAEMSQEDRKQSRSSKKAEEGRQAESQATGGSGPEAGVQAQSGSREQVRDGQDDEGHRGCQERHHRHRGRGIKWAGITAPLRSSSVSFRNP